MKRVVASVLLSLLISPVFAENVVITDSDKASQMVHIEKTPIPLQSNLKKRYQAYNVSVVNDYPGKLQLTSASIDNGVMGSVAAGNSSKSYLNALWGLPLGLLGIGIGALVVANKNTKTDTESSQFVNAVPTPLLRKGESVGFKALVPTGQQPSIKIHFSDEANGLEFSKATF